MERVLVEEILSDGTGCFHFQSVTRRKRIHTYHLYDFFQLCLFLKKGHHSLTELHPVIRYIFVKPSANAVQIQRIAGQPVDRREMTFVCKVCIQSPEYLYDSKCRLGNRLGDITTWRRYGADRCQGTLSSVFSTADHMSGTLIELCKTGTKICRITFLAWHLLQSSGHLTESLSPSGSRICHQCYGISHITEILRNCNTCIDRRLTSCNRHI